MSWQEEVNEIELRHQLALGLGGTENVARQHAGGRLTVRERIDALVDPGSFLELVSLAADVRKEDGQIVAYTPVGFVGGVARIEGRDVTVVGEDFTVRGGSESQGGFAKQRLMERLSTEYRIPHVALLEGAGGSVRAAGESGYTSPPNAGASWQFAVRMMDTVPVASAVLGSVAGGPSGRAMLSHFSCMVESSELFVGGPPLVKAGIGLSIHKHDLGGPDVHVRTSGVIHNAAPTEQECFALLRRFLSYMPGSVWSLPPYSRPDDQPDRCEEALLSIVPRDRRRAYDMRELIRLVVDRGSFFETQPEWGKAVITGLARLDGHVVGIVANNPAHIGGALDGPGSDKLTYWLELFDSFRIPVLNFIDVPGFMVGPQAEQSGTLRRGMRALWMMHHLSVPKIDLNIRRCYGIAGAAMANPEHICLRLAWPSAEWGALPVEGGVDAAFRREIENAPDPAARRKELEAALLRLRSPFGAAQAGVVEEVIDPRQTRPLCIRWLETALPSLQAGPLGPKAKTGVRP